MQIKSEVLKLLLWIPRFSHQCFSLAIKQAMKGHGGCDEAVAVASKLQTLGQRIIGRRRYRLALQQAQPNSGKVQHRTGTAACPPAHPEKRLCPAPPRNARQADGPRRRLGEGFLRPLCFRPEAGRRPSRQLPMRNCGQLREHQCQHASSPRRSIRKKVLPLGRNHGAGRRTVKARTNCAKAAAAEARLGTPRRPQISLHSALMASSVVLNRPAISRFL